MKHLITEIIPYDVLKLEKEKLDELNAFVNKTHFQRALENNIPTLWLEVAANKKHNSRWKKIFYIILMIDILIVYSLL